MLSALYQRLRRVPSRQFQQQVKMREQDKGRRQHWFRFVFDDERITLELPNMARVGVHTIEGIADGGVWRYGVGRWS